MQRIFGSSALRFAALALMVAGCMGDVDDVETENAPDVGTPDAPDVETEDSPDVETANGPGVDLANVPEKTRAIAEALLDELSGSDMTPNWADAPILGEVAYPMFRTDMAEPAYYEFAVIDGGRILVATGTHDSPIPTFSDVGGPIAEELIAKAGAEASHVARLYRVDAQTYIAADDADMVLATAGGPPREMLPTVADYRDDLSARQKNLKSQSELESYGPSPADEWAELYRTTLKGDYDDTNPYLSVKNVKWVWHQSLLRTYLQWSQHDVDTSSDVCWSGCGPVALGQIAAYLAYSDRWGNPKYAGTGARNLYPNVSLAFNWRAQNLVEELRAELGTTCYLWGEQAATKPWRMDDFIDWAGRKGARVRMDIDAWGGDEDKAVRHIRIGDPVVFGMGFYAHYNIGVGAGTLNGSDYVWVNQGWGGSGDGWLRLGSTFFTGIVLGK